jgi:hypothetical protein
MTERIVIVIESHTRGYKNHKGVSRCSIYCFAILDSDGDTLMKFFTTDVPMFLEKIEVLKGSFRESEKLVRLVYGC